MISMQTLAIQQLPAWRTPLRDPRKPAADQISPGFGLPSMSDLRDRQKAMRKEMAARKVQAVIDRRDALMLMVKIDPKSALKMTTDLAKALKEAVKDFVDAGGRNPSNGDLAMMRRGATDAREAADAAVEGLPPKPADEADVKVEASAAEAERVDTEIKRAQAAYAAAFGMADVRDETADRAEAVFGAALSDSGFFDQVRRVLGSLKEAREKIRSEWAHLKAPNKEDWKIADQAMAALEKQIDMAPTGAPAISDAPRGTTA